jgi:hypothetical protein
LSFLGKPKLFLIEAKFEARAQAGDAVVAAGCHSAAASSVTGTFWWEAGRRLAAVDAGTSLRPAEAAGAACHAAPHVELGARPRRPSFRA